MPGAERLRDCEVLTQLVAKQQGADKLLAAICATPAVAFEPQGEMGCHVTPCHAWLAGASQV
jgi:4-methyl-5(b-hydroxyethyl)-thiazole monophosphate biosynthesis